MTTLPDSEANNTPFKPDMPALVEQTSAQVYDRKQRFGTNTATYTDYGFGVPFSYWKSWEEYDFCAAKYKELKQELLQNEICTISVERWNDIYKKGEELYIKIATILGQNKDKNTAKARHVTHWNDLCNIKCGTPISLNHLLSILFYTDLSELPMRMKIVCRKIAKNETIKDVAKRHCEFVNWLKLLTETLLFYGNNLSHRGNPIYHGLNKRFLFDQFKAKFHIPTSTTTDRSQAVNFAGDNGIVLQFGGLESKGDPYFDTKSISAFPNEEEYLFFRAELNISMFYISVNKFSMAPLSLYQSITNGSIIIDKAHLDKKSFNKTQKQLNEYLKLIENENEEQDEQKADGDDVKKYGIEMLENFIDKNQKIYINDEQIKSKITMKALRLRFIQQDSQKEFIGYSSKLLENEKNGNIKIKKAEHYSWTPKEDELKEFLKEKENEDDNYVASRPKKCDDGSKFYCQMNLRKEIQINDENDGNDVNDEKKEEIERTGRMSLILWKLPKGQTHKKISCDFFCKQLGSFYVRFHNQPLTLDAYDWDKRITITFKWNKLVEAIEKGKDINWTISIRDVGDTQDEMKPDNAADTSL